VYYKFFNLPKKSSEDTQPSLSRRIKQKLQSYMEPQEPSSSKSASSDLPIYMKQYPLSKSCRVINVSHHLAHAASTYYTSGLYNEKTLIVTMDGVGEKVSVAIWRGQTNRIELLRSWDDSGSIGWFYSVVTEALEWRHGSDEWKTMGLAPYGTPSPGSFKGFHPEFKDGQLVTPHDFGEASRWPDHGVNHYHLRDAVTLQPYVARMGRENTAAEAQRVVEEQITEIIYPWLKKEQTRNLCCAGGVFLNVKMNQKVWYSGNVDIHWVFPNPGDSGLAAGAALYAYYFEHLDQPTERLQNLYLGPEYSNDQICAILKERKLNYEYYDNISEVAAYYLADNRIIAWFQGRMETGPRALGNRSILMSPLRAEHKDIINACVKYREAFRPFCPSLLDERTSEYLVNPREEPFMITSFEVRPEKAGRIPAVVHVDQTVRPQTVHREQNPRYHELISTFEKLTGEGIILNTSFNIKGEPIICHPREAIRCFFDTGLDVLIMGNYLLRKPGVPAFSELKAG
jgi:carbamoyltransferase